MRIGVVTVGRSDYGIYTPVLRALQKSPTLEFELLVSGTHLAAQFGKTVSEIERDGFPIGARVPILESGDEPIDIANAISRGVSGFAAVYARQRPELLMVLGDRFEMYSAALAAVPFNIPIAHLHGGELTLGAMDDALRHSLTKLSHLHFVSTEDYARRVRQLGEEAWRVTVSGAPSLDNLTRVHRVAPRDLRERFGIDVETSFLLVTFHPATLESDIQEQGERFIAALSALAMPTVVTLPNADVHGTILRKQFRDRAATGAPMLLIENLGTEAYFSVMSYASAMVGNSSSGIIEAASFGLPVVNVGSRQDGRIKPANVIDVQCNTDDIVRGVERATSEQFRKSIKGLRNPYGDGHASERITARLEEIKDPAALIHKRFTG